MRRRRALDAFSGEGGTGMGLHLAGFDVYGIDKSKERLELYPFDCEQVDDAVPWIAQHGHKFDLIFTGPTCTGYSRGTAALPDRLSRYDRLIGVTREACKITGKPYVIENVEDAKSEMDSPMMLCGTMFNLRATDADGEQVWLQRHRMFESNLFLYPPGPCNHPTDIRCAGVYSGARSDKWEAKHVRKGGYTPKGEQVQTELLGIDWMSAVGRRLSIPPVYTRYLGEQILEGIEAAA